MSNPPTNPYPYGYETWTEKFSRKFKENPWVPAGCLATTLALTMSAIKMRQGKSKSMNYWMRARVGLQGLTLVALVAGSMALKRQREETAALESSVDSLILTLASPSSTQQEKDALLAKTDSKVLALLEQRQSQSNVEKAEFAERLREAEVAAKEEEAMGRQRVVKGPTVVKHEKGAVGASTGEVHPPTVGDVGRVEREGEVKGEVKGGRSWWRVW